MPGKSSITDNAQGIAVPTSGVVAPVPLPLPPRKFRAPAALYPRPPSISNLSFELDAKLDAKKECGDLDKDADLSPPSLISRGLSGAQDFSSLSVSPVPFLEHEHEHEYEYASRTQGAGALEDLEDSRSHAYVSAPSSPSRSYSPSLPPPPSLSSMPDDSIPPPHPHWKMML